MEISVVEGSSALFAPGTFYRELIAYAVAEGRASGFSTSLSAPIRVGSPPVSAVNRLALAADRALARRTGSVSSRVAKVLRGLNGRDASGSPAMWFTGENVRPPGDSCWSSTFSFDADALDGRNAYLPIWWGDIDLLPGFNPPNWRRLGGRLLLDEMLAPRAGRTQRREKFVCAFINNPEPMRMRYLEMLRSIGEVDIFGRVTGRRVESKIDIARNYRFMLCFENDVYPGYVTEKAFEAWRSGCVPLWRGDDVEGYLNTDAMVNAAQMPSAEFLYHVNRINESHESWVKLTSQPILNKRPSLTQAVALIRKSVSCVAVP